MNKFQVVPCVNMLRDGFADFSFARGGPQCGADFESLLQRLNNGVQGDKSACTGDKDVRRSFHLLPMVNNKAVITPNTLHAKLTRSLSSHFQPRICVVGVPQV